jgi:hypothetical protein
VAIDERYAAIWAEHQALRAQAVQANEALQRAEAALNTAEQRFRQTGDPTARDHHAAQVAVLSEQKRGAEERVAQLELAAAREDPQYAAWLEAQEAPAQARAETSRAVLAVELAGVAASALNLGTRDFITDGMVQEQLAYAVANREALVASAMGIAEAPAQDRIALEAALAEQQREDFATNLEDVTRAPAHPEPGVQEINEALAQIEREDAARFAEARQRAETPAPQRDVNDVLQQVEQDDRGFHELEREKQQQREALAAQQEQARTALEARTAALDEQRRTEILKAQELKFEEQRRALEERMAAERQRLLDERDRR